MHLKEIWKFYKENKEAMFGYTTMVCLIIISVSFAVGLARMPSELKGGYLPKFISATRNIEWMKYDIKDLRYKTSELLYKHELQDIMLHSMYKMRNNP